MLVQILLSVFRATRPSFDARICMRAIPPPRDRRGPSLLPDWATEAVVGPVAVFAAGFAAAAEAEFDAAGADVRWYCVAIFHTVLLQGRTALRVHSEHFAHENNPHRLRRAAHLVSYGISKLPSLCAGARNRHHASALPVWPFTVILMGGPSTGGQDLVVAVPAAVLAGLVTSGGGVQI